MEGKQLDKKIDFTYYSSFWYAFVYIALSTSFLIITVLVSIVIRFHHSYSKWPSYQIMFYISLCDMAQLVAHLFGGVALMLEWDMPDVLNIFLGSILSGTWFASNIYGILLALQRLFSLVFPSNDLKIFTGKCKTIIFTLAHFSMLIFTVLQWTKWSHNKFYREKLSWYYDKSLPLGNIFTLVDEYSVVPFILCSFVCYSMIFYTLKTKDASKKMENVITINVFVYCVFCTCTFILWRFVEPWIEHDAFTYFWTNLPWILYNGANAIICICFNKTVRVNVLKLLHCQRINENRVSVRVWQKSQTESKKTLDGFHCRHLQTIS